MHHTCNHSNKLVCCVVWESRSKSKLSQQCAFEAGFLVSFIFLIWELQGSMQHSFLMLPNIRKLQLSGTIEWNSPPLYKISWSFRNWYSWLQMEMEQPRRWSCSNSTSYWGAVEGRKWHLTAWGWAASGQLVYSGHPSTYRNRLTVLLVFIDNWGEMGGMGQRAEGIISASLHLAAARGDKQENQYSHSGQFTTRASLSAPVCQSQSLMREGMELLTR